MVSLSLSQGLSYLSGSLSSALYPFKPNKKGSFSNAVAGMSIACFAADSVKYFFGKTPLSGLTGLFRNIISIQPAITITGTLNNLRSPEFISYLKVNKPAMINPTIIDPNPKFAPLKAFSVVLGALGDVCETVSFFNGFDFSSFSRISSRIGTVDFAANGFCFGSAAISLIHRNWAQAKIRAKYGVDRLPKNPKQQKIAHLKNYKDAAQLIGTALSMYAAYSPNKYIDVASKVALRAANCLSLRMACLA